MRLPKRFRSENGYSLLIAIFAILLISILGISMIAISANVMKTTVNERDDQSVYYIAEAGLAEMRAEINALATKAFKDVDEEYQAITDPQKKEAFLLAKSFEDRFLDTAKRYIENHISNENFSKQYDKQFDDNSPPKANVNVIPSNGKDYTYEIISIGNVGSKNRTVSQIVTIAFGHTIETEEITIGGPGGESGPSENITFKACSNGFFNSATTSGSVKIGGDVILKDDSILDLGGGNNGINGNIYSFGNLSITNSAPINGGIYSNGFIKLLNNMTIEGNVLALGDITFTNSSTINGNVLSKSAISISSTPKINGQLYAGGPITITNGPKVAEEMVSERNITITNWGTEAKKIIAGGNVNTPDPKLIVEQNIPFAQLPKPLVEFNGLGEISEMYKDSDCINLASDDFKPKLPEVTFQTTANTLPGDTELIEFSDSKKELHVNEFNYSKYGSVNIKLPESDENTVYSLYINKLNMNHRDIHVSGNGKLNIYVKDTLSLGKIIQHNDSKGKKRNNFKTTVYYLNDNKKELTLSNWGNCKVEANLYVKDANLTNNGCSVNGNIVVLGNNTVTLAGNNTTNGQIFYLPDSDLVASGLVNINGSVIGKNLSGSGNITISPPSSSDGSDYIDTDIFDTPSSPTKYEVTNYESTTLLITEEQKEK